MKQKIGRSYIKCRLKWIAAVTGCGIVMTAVLFLNEVPAGEIAYGMLLCLGILLLAVTMDRISYGRRHRELLALRQSITVSLENLPEPGEILEEDYQRLLGLLAEEKMRIWNTAVSEKRDLMEYYTMWVHQIKTPIAAMRLLLQDADGHAAAHTAAQTHQDPVLFFVGVKPVPGQKSIVHRPCLPPCAWLWATASWSQRSFSGWPAWPLTQT